MKPEARSLKPECPAPNYQISKGCLLPAPSSSPSDCIAVPRESANVFISLRSRPNERDTGARSQLRHRWNRKSQAGSQVNSGCLIPLLFGGISRAQPLASFGRETHPDRDLRPVGPVEDSPGREPGVCSRNTMSPERAAQKPGGTRILWYFRCRTNGTLRDLQRKPQRRENHVTNSNAGNGCRMRPRLSWVPGNRLPSRSMDLLSRTSIKRQAGQIRRLAPAD